MLVPRLTPHAHATVIVAIALFFDSCNGFHDAAKRRVIVPLPPFLGISVSTTHTITGGIVGVGAVTHANTVKWNVALRVVWAWLFTLQVSGLLAAGVYLLLRACGLSD